MCCRAEVPVRSLADQLVRPAYLVHILWLLRIGSHGRLTILLLAYLGNILSGFSDTTEQGFRALINSNIRGPLTRG